ncbi:choice-of-anchor I family protein [uncultured Enterovirga sp.]|uniref:choice-of-anchor I family protein n=1 Tax=uncultured Enterovirga sp. TaxID=2026352 RepID=UPI0035CC44C4
MSTTPFQLSTGNFSQDWTNTGLITANDSWATVPSVVGYLGDISTGSAVDVDPRTLTGSTTEAVDVIANQTVTTINNGGVAEFQITNPTVAFQGSGTADAPNLVIYLDSTGRQNVRVQFTARDIDSTVTGGNEENATQQLAVQYRLSNTSAWTNVPGGYDADVTSLGATEVTSFDLTLPADANNAAGLQVRILTTNAAGNDEWVGIDDIVVSSQAPAPTDVVAPVLTTSSPADEATAIAVGSDLVLTFDEAVVRGSGNIILRPAAGADVVIDVTDATQVTISGTTVTINPTAALAAGTAYNVIIPGSAFTDAAGNSFVGTQNAVSGLEAGELNFTTAAPGAAPLLVGGIQINDAAASLAGLAGAAPVASGALQLVRLGAYATTDNPATAGVLPNAEVVAYDGTTGRLYVQNTNESRIEIVSISSAGALAKTGEILLTGLDSFGSVNSVAVKNGLVAVAYANADGSQAGRVALFDQNGGLQKILTVGVGPDQLVFTPDGNRILVANEAETAGTTAAPILTAGGISVIDVTGGLANVASAVVVSTIGFGALDGADAAAEAVNQALLQSKGLAIFPGRGNSEDIEPEYITISADGTRAYVVLQEVNGVAILDITPGQAPSIVAIQPLGSVDHRLAGNEFDASDQDGTAGAAAINITAKPFNALLQPDSIASYQVGGATYFITANEGDQRVISGADDADVARLSSASVVLDPSIVNLKTNAEYRRLNVLTKLGDTDGDGDIDQVHTLGGRSISIFRDNGDGTVTKVRETGGEFEKIFAAQPGAAATPAGTFNQNQGPNTFDTRSDDKGPEPEGVTIGQVGGRTYAFVALERQGGVIVYDVTDPGNANYVSYVPPVPAAAGQPVDFGPEVLTFIAADQNPTGTALVISANEVASAVNGNGGATVYAALQQGFAQELRFVPGSLAISQNEGASGATTAYSFTVERTNGTLGDLTFTASAAGSGASPADAADFGGALPSITGTIAAGQTSTVVTITVSGDAANERSETFSLTLSGAANSQGGIAAAVSPTAGVATGTIVADDLTAIYQIQGATHFSAFDGQVVSTQGIVTARASNGFYIQDATGDGDVATSDAVFVFTGTAPAAGITIGANVVVTGTVDEFVGAGRTGDLSLTEIVSPTVTVLTQDIALPAATLLGAGGRLPPLVSLGDDDAMGVYDPATQGTDFYESVEGMLVTIKDVVTTGPFRSNFGEIVVRYDVGPNPSVNDRGGLTISDTTPGTLQPADKIFDFNPERIQLDDRVGFATPVPTATGDRLGDVTGIVGYEFGFYDLNPTAAVTLTPSTITPETTTITANLDRLRVATFNVENLAPVGQPVDGVATTQAKFNGLADAIIGSLGTPEIIALQEVLDNDGATNSSTVSASLTLSQLIDAITARGGPRYVAIDSLPIDDTVGGIPGGNQRVAYLYRADSVTPTDRNGLSTIVSDANGAKVLQAPTANQIGQGDSDFAATRKSLPIEWSPVGFTDAQGGTFWTVNNHLSSKGGSLPLIGNSLELPLYADPLNGAAQTAAGTTQNEREGQAEIVNAYIDGILVNASATDDRVVALGDFNDFQFFPVIDLITGQVVRTQANPDGTASIFAPSTPVMGKLLEKLPVAERYSYNFDGNAQALDQILVSNNLYGSAEVDVVHINSEFATQISDHDPSVSSLLFSRSAAIATEGNDTFDQASYTARFGGTRGSLGGNDVISALGGDDQVAAGAGNDTVDGGANGAAGDTLVLTGARSNYTVTEQGGGFVIADNRGAGGDGTDTVVNVESFAFSDRVVAAGQLADVAAPTLVSSTPADNATQVSAASNIVLTFSEAVQAGAGAITITNGAGDVQTIAVTDASQVTVSGATVTINPTANLAAGAAYDVIIPTGAITDNAGNSFAGLATDQLDFTTEMPPVANYTLQLLHMSDGEGSTLTPTTAPIMGALIDRFDDQYVNSLVLAGGDNIIPGPFLNAGADPSLNPIVGGTTALGRPDIAIYNAFGVSASALGNHEWDLGSSVLNGAYAPASGWVGAQFPYLSADLDFSGDSFIRGTVVAGGQEASSIRGKVAPSAIVTEGGERIGIVGATTQVLERISSPTGTEVNGFPKNGQPGDNTTEVDNMQLLATQLQPVIDALIAQGVNKIILTSHLQLLSNEQTLAGLLRGVDIIVAAGSHTRLGDSTDAAAAFPGHDANFQGSYPIVTAGADGAPTLIVATDSESTYLGRLVVDFDANGQLVLSSLDPAISGAYASTQANLQAAYGADIGLAFATGSIGQKVQTITNAVNNVIASKDGNIFGFTDVYLEGDRVFGRSEETNLGDISADANTAALQAIDPSQTLVVSLKNGGGIRASIGSVSDGSNNTAAGQKLPPAANPTANKPEGAISQLDAENALRFDNKLMVFDTTPQGLLNILNYAAGLPAGNGGFPQVGGVRFSYDPDFPAGQKVQTVALYDDEDRLLATVVRNGQVVADAPARISVVTLNFTANGGDGYPVKANGENFRYLLQDGTLSAPVAETLDFVTATPANALGEIKAFQDYLRAEFPTADDAFGIADTPASLDLRIENLNLRADAVLDGLPANSAPDAEPDSLAPLAHTIATGNLLANDSDPDTGDTLAVTSIRFANSLSVAVPGSGMVTVEGGHGTLKLAADGQFSYVATLAGVDSFTYTVRDGDGATATASLTASVAANPPAAEASFGFAFLFATLTFEEGAALLTGPDGVTRDVTGVGRLVFTDGQIDEQDGTPLVDDLFYFAQNRDVYAAHVDPEQHYAQFGWLEGRDPNALFSTKAYLAQNPDVAAAKVDPLQHYDVFGWKEGRDPGPEFSTLAYLAQNPDVAAARIDPLAHALGQGATEGRAIFPGESVRGITGDFDAGFYLAQYPDVAAARVDPLQHYLTSGWLEGRDPDAFFSTREYLAANPDVAAAGISPLLHFEAYGWEEGRNPSSEFSTNGYLAANPDVAAADIDPLQHYLVFGEAEGRNGWQI